MVISYFRRINIPTNRLKRREKLTRSRKFRDAIKRAINTNIDERTAILRRRKKLSVRKQDSEIKKMSIVIII